MVNDEETGYPRHPRFILKQIREGMGFNQTDGGKKLSIQCHWPKGRWANLEKGNQEFKFEYLYEMVHSGVIAENSSEYFEISSWIDLQKTIQEQEERRKANNPPPDPDPEPEPEPEPPPRQDKQEEKQPHEPPPEQKKKQPPEPEPTTPKEPEPSPPPVVTAPGPKREADKTRATAPVPVNEPEITLRKRLTKVIGVITIVPILMIVIGILLSDPSLFLPSPATATKAPHHVPAYWNGVPPSGTLQEGERLELPYGTIAVGEVIAPSPLATGPFRTMRPGWEGLPGWEHTEVITINLGKPNEFKALEYVPYWTINNITDEHISDMVEHLFENGCGGEGCDKVRVITVGTHAIGDVTRERPN